MNSSGLRRRLGIGALFATLALFLAGCMKMDMNLTLNEDDTADGTIIMAFSDEFAESLGQDPQALWDQMGSEMESDLPPGATQEPYAEDGYTGTKMTYTGQPISEMSTGSADELSITREGDEFVVSGTMDMSDEELGLDGSDPSTDEMTRQMMDGFEVIISITFPGEVGETNGEVDGNTVTWRPVMGEVNEISARGSAVAGGASAGSGSEGGTTDEGTTGSDGSTSGSTAGSDSDSGSGFPWWLLGLIGGIVLLAIIGLVLWLVLRKKPDGADTATAQGGYPGQYPPPPGTYPGQYTPAQGYPGRPGPQQPGQYPPAQGGYPGQSYPGQPGPQQPGQYPPAQGGYPGQPYPGQPGGPYAPPQGAPAHPQQSPTTPYAQGPVPTQPLPPAPGPVPPAPTQPLPPQQGAPGPENPGSDGDDEIDDATRLRPPS
ncbi:LppM family (lipo)protein [Cellulosimicrobium marinum]|uniref:LppM family (lipo)protein n=1 Tax=Cellulosimicrobium marinum TaxID=1638992 RepID=UPI001E4F81DB|nr:hypothetical protein [Cellulosimicrobium marinum]MCB7135106.1 hypothetical protein [Cellulosimicrobium marinum]